MAELPHKHILLENNQADKTRNCEQFFQLVVYYTIT